MTSRLISRWTLTVMIVVVRRIEGSLRLPIILGPHALDAPGIDLKRPGLAGDMNVGLAGELPESESQITVSCRPQRRRFQANAGLRVASMLIALGRS